METTKILLPEKEMPRSWYNVLPDLPKPLEPPLHPGTRQPVGPDDLAPLFPEALILQEMSPEREIPIPEDILDVYSIWRPTPLIRARRLERVLDTPARIYYKNEGVSPPGSHKPNTSVAQAWYNKQAGVKRLATETGAGQWGSALSFACRAFGLECSVYMVKVSYEQKPYRRTMMQIWGADVTPSPSEKTDVGKKILENDPDCPGSLGIAISEAVWDAATHDDTKYALGSVLNHVVIHQSLIGLEAIRQLEMVEDKADIVIGCVGGGSNFGGLISPFVPRKSAGEEVRLVAAEPCACPTLTKGLFAYDYGDTAKMTPLMMMYTLGHSFVPPKIHAGGLRYHGDSPILSLLVKEGMVEPVAYTQNEVFDAAVMFAGAEGIVPAPETSHAVKAAVDEAVRCREAGEEKTILVGFSGHGHFDMLSYEAYLENRLEDYAMDDVAVAECLERDGICGESE
ncbi:MAG: TrpB-like pyridoxal phosphate-dependent enzyme [Candidatus Eisenbacteria bacterium]|nr:TrpB-like pyridoxal phosphate-dependent enzyme [Candidatus Eisenbacteria bacterium]